MDIRYLEPADASALVQCFRDCYGETYANRSFYDPSVVTRLIEDGTLKSVVAVENGKVLGHTGLTVKDPHARAAEAGNTVVTPSARGRGLLGKLGSALRDRSVKEGYVGYVHYPTTAHDIMQKSATSGTGRETGIMLCYIPDSTEYNNFNESHGRLAATIVYQPLADGPALSVFVPDNHASLIVDLSNRLKLKRELIADPGYTSDAATLDVTHTRSRGITHIRVIHNGADLASRIDDVMDDALPVIHVDLPMSEPGIGQAAKELGHGGFAYAGWLPYFGVSDILRLQRIDHLTTSEQSPMLVTGEARALRDMIVDELTA